MRKPPATEIRRVLSEKVARRVAGRGVPRSAIDDAVARVVDALDGSGRPPSPPPQPDAARAVLAAFSASSTPDLASRLRRDFEREGIVIEDMGSGAAGRHTVVAIRISAAFRPAVERLAERSRYGLSFVNIDAGASTA